jgi:hypothetical protein
VKKFIFLFFILHSVISFSQKITYTGIILVDSLPEELLPAGVAELGFVTAGDNNQPVGFGYEMGGGQYKIISKFGKEFDDFKGADCKAFYRNDTLFFWSLVKYKSDQTYHYYGWDSKKLNYWESYTYDASKEAEQNGDAALRKKNVREAAQYYNQIEYTPIANQAKIAFKLLGVAHYLAKEAALADVFAESIEYMDGAFVYQINKSFIEAANEYAYNKIVMATFETKQIDSLGPWMSDYAYYLYKGDSLERSLTLAEFVNACYPKLAEAYLVRADVLFDLQREEESKPFYDRYDILMVNRGDESLIPQRVKDRIK